MWMLSAQGHLYGNLWPLYVFISSSQPRVTSFRDLVHEAKEESDEEEGQRYIWFLTIILVSSKFRLTIFTLRYVIMIS